jgi:3-oxoacyl-[acyl-carrier-protein] synthase II
MKRTVVITGIGIISPVGIGKNIFWDALSQGRTGFRPITLFDTSEYNVHIAGEISDFDPVQFLGKKGLRELDRSSRLLNTATKLALEDSRLEITEESSHSIGVSIGTTFGSLHSIFQFDRDGLIDGPRLVNPSRFPNTVINSPASRVSIRFTIKGFNTTVSTGFCASLDAVAYAADFIRLGRANAVLAGGVEELCEETFLGFYKLNYLSGMDNSEPVCCPFDARRNGLILSEGAAVIILEDEEHAIKRGAPVLAKVLGYGNAFDPSGDTDFRHAGHGLKNAITCALKESSLVPHDIHYISSGANSSQGLDRMETEAIKEVFGEHAYKIPVSAMKSIIGESFSASGALALAAAVGTIQHGIIYPTAHYRDQDPACDLDYVPNKARAKNIQTALILSSDPYGNNTAMVIQKYEK